MKNKVDKNSEGAANKNSKGGYAAALGSETLLRLGRIVTRSSMQAAAYNLMLNRRGLSEIFNIKSIKNVLIANASLEALHLIHRSMVEVNKYATERKPKNRAGKAACFTLATVSGSIIGLLERKMFGTFISIKNIMDLMRGESLGFAAPALALALGILKLTKNGMLKNFITSSLTAGTGFSTTASLMQAASSASKKLKDLLLGKKDIDSKVESSNAEEAKELSTYKDSSAIEKNYNNAAEIGDFENKFQQAEREVKEQKESFEEQFKGAEQEQKDEGLSLQNAYQEAQGQIEEQKKTFENQYKKAEQEQKDEELSLQNAYQEAQGQVEEQKKTFENQYKAVEQGQSKGTEKISQQIEKKGIKREDLNKNIQNKSLTKEQDSQKKSVEDEQNLETVWNGYSKGESEKTNEEVDDKKEIISQNLESGQEAQQSSKDDQEMGEAYNAEWQDAQNSPENKMQKDIKVREDIDSPSGAATDISNRENIQKDQGNDIEVAQKHPEQKANEQSAYSEIESDSESEYYSGSDSDSESDFGSESDDEELTKESIRSQENEKKGAAFHRYENTQEKDIKAAPKVINQSIDEKTSASPSWDRGLSETADNQSAKEIYEGARSLINSSISDSLNIEWDESNQDLANEQSINNDTALHVEPVENEEEGVGFNKDAADLADLNKAWEDIKLVNEQQSKEKTLGLANSSIINENLSQELEAEYDSAKHNVELKSFSKEEDKKAKAELEKQVQELMSKFNDAKAEYENIAGQKIAVKMEGDKLNKHVKKLSEEIKKQVTQETTYSPIAKVKGNQMSVNRLGALSNNFIQGPDEKSHKVNKEGLLKRKNHLLERASELAGHYAELCKKHLTCENRMQELLRQAASAASGKIAKNKALSKHIKENLLTKIPRPNL